MECFEDWWCASVCCVVFKVQSTGYSDDDLIGCADGECNIEENKRMLVASVVIADF